jgi:CheY-like chemotaxis protein
VRNLRPGLPVIYLSSGNTDLAHEALLAGAHAYATKPFGDGSLLRALGTALELA